MDEVYCKGSDRLYFFPTRYIAGSHDRGSTSDSRPAETSKWCGPAWPATCAVRATFQGKLMLSCLLLRHIFLLLLQTLEIENLESRLRKEAQRLKNQEKRLQDMPHTAGTSLFHVYTVYHGLRLALRNINESCNECRRAFHVFKEKLVPCSACLCCSDEITKHIEKFGPEDFSKSTYTTIRKRRIFL